MTLLSPTRSDLAALLPVLDAATVFARARLAKAAQPAALRARNRLFADVVPGLSADLAAYFEALAERIEARVAKAIEVDWADEAIDWEVEDKELGTVLARWYTQLGEGAYAAVSEQLGVELRWDLGARGVRRVLDRVGNQVAGIVETTRDLLRVKVADAIDRGLSIEELVRGVEGFAGLRDLVAGWSTSRATLIALTETANTYNLAAVAGYRDSGLVEEVEVYDGPDCGWTEHDDPDLADGSTRTLDEADEYPIAHPHCQRAFGPVVVR